MEQTAEKPPLGVGNILSSAASTFFSKFTYIFVISFVAVLVSFITYTILGISVLNQPFADGDFSGTAVFGFIIQILVDSLVGAFVGILVTFLTYDTVLGRQINISAYLSKLSTLIVTVLLVSIVMGLGIGLATLALIIPGLILTMIWYVTIPSVVIEEIGFGGFGRSQQLTSGYRWPIFGLVLLVGLILLGIGMGIGAVLGATGWLGGPVLLAIQYLGMSFSAILAATTYARLREIKEGVSVDSIADVFS
ncbi:hypothetical protein [Actibacterium sp. 188UL27-1]|uniref:hypothetical protein n=1 Tax=Actibacterium sp. 188UL27-1 TaxID=2786961 RepID=UPI00195EAED6|nr:hypothetical protein [Actibacterium sp. 188UL27-1]MBM7066337.1 hypothetical protein [Actibacterium sp. 188UL27-1]